jgi:ComF family protein
MPGEVNSLLNALRPSRCILCGIPSGRLDVCAGCRADLPWIVDACAGCGSPLGAPAAAVNPPHPRECADRSCAFSSSAVAQACAAFVYEYPVDRLITLAKFQARTDCARLLGDMLAMHLRRLRMLGRLKAPDCIVPVPLHPQRMATRGYNQAEEIARPVAHCLRIPLKVTGCRRARNTVAQTSLTGKARRRNLTGAFHVDGGCAGQAVAIVDDVLTTGSTVAALSAALLSAGAARVLVWTVARTEDQRGR